MGLFGKNRDGKAEEAAGLLRDAARRGDDEAAAAAIARLAELGEIEQDPDSGIWRGRD